jgi:hypothetical protein
MGSFGGRNQKLFTPLFGWELKWRRECEWMRWRME